jgi:multidrug efflux pump subunit AcrA (membrane-fusion protein)
VQSPYRQKDKRPPLLSRLFVQAQIEGKAIQNVFVLPTIAMNASQDVLLVDSEQKLHIRHLDVLRNEPNRILVKKGLNAGDRIVTSGIDVPVEGMMVRVDENANSGRAKADSR